MHLVNTTTLRSTATVATRRTWSLRSRAVLVAFAVSVLGRLDLIYRMATGRRHLPPFALRVRTGSPLRLFGGARWIQMGQQMLQELKQFCGLRPTDDVVEIGCSCGIVAMPLQSYLTTGRYTGLDIIPESIAWCHRHLGNERFRFADLNVHHPIYNPGGTADPDNVRLPIENGSADVVFLVSVFTHMLPDTIHHYLREISRILKPGGRCLATMLTKDRYVAGRAVFQLHHRVSDDCLCWDAENPTIAVAVSHALISRLAENSGLTISQMAPGKWDGCAQSSYLHDMYVFTKVS